MKQGEQFTAENVRSIRPGQGLHTRHMTEVMGRRAARNIERGTPLSWELIDTQADRQIDTQIDAKVDSRVDSQ
jgi:hypothetical protein